MAIFRQLYENITKIDNKLILNKILLFAIPFFRNSEANTQHGVFQNF
jgi:hypothetical protein